MAKPTHRYPGIDKIPDKTGLIVGDIVRAKTQTTMTMNMMRLAMTQSDYFALPVRARDKTRMLLRVCKLLNIADVRGYPRIYVSDIETGDTFTAPYNRGFSQYVFEKDDFMSAVWHQNNPPRKPSKNENVSNKIEDSC